MSKLTGRLGDLLRFGLASRNWILTQMSSDSDVMKWMSSGVEKSASQIVSHVSWTISAVVTQIASQLDIELKDENAELEQVEDEFESEIRIAYNLFKQLCTNMTEDMLDIQTTLPPPARLQKSSVETILRIIAGYHTVHHAGQIALMISAAKRDET